MKSILTTALLTMSCLTAYTHASAQASAQAKVPFEFSVGQRVLPAGTNAMSIKSFAQKYFKMEAISKGQR